MSYYRPQWYVRLDLESDGYQHPDCDITDYFDLITFDVGHNLNTGTQRSRTNSNSGNLIVRNSEYKFNPEGSLALHASSLRRDLPFEFGYREGGAYVPVFIGIAEPPEATASSTEIRTARFRLKGVHTDLIAEQWPTESFQLPDTYAAPALFDYIGAEGGLQLAESYVNPLALGLVSYSGDIRGALDDLAAYADGYPLEDSNGRIRLVCPRQFAAAHQPGGVRFGRIIDLRGLGIFISSDAGLRKRNGLVRNFVRTRSYGIIAGALNDRAGYQPNLDSGFQQGVSEVIVDSTVNIPPRAKIQRSWRLDIPGAVGIEAVRAEVTPTSGTESRASARIDEANLSVVRVTLQDEGIDGEMADYPGGTFSLRVFALISRVRETSSSEYSNALSIQEYGKREITTPDWYPSDGSLTAARQLINRRNKAFYTANVRIPLLFQSDLSQFERVINAASPPQMMNVLLNNEADGLALQRSMISLQTRWTVRKSGDANAEIWAVESPTDFNGELLLLGHSKLGRNAVLGKPASLNLELDHVRQLSNGYIHPADSRFSYNGLEYRWARGRSTNGGRKFRLEMLPLPSERESASGYFIWGGNTITASEKGQLRVSATDWTDDDPFPLRWSDIYQLTHTDEAFPNPNFTSATNITANWSAIGPVTPGDQLLLNIWRPSNSTRGEGAVYDITDYTLEGTNLQRVRSAMMRESGVTAPATLAANEVGLQQPVNFQLTRWVVRYKYVPEQVSSVAQGEHNLPGNAVLLLHAADDSVTRQLKLEDANWNYNAASGLHSWVWSGEGFSTPAKYSFYIP